MKKIILSGTLFLFALMAFAQTDPKPEQRKERFTPEQKATLLTKKMQLKLDLSAEQYDKLLAVNTDFMDGKKEAVEKPKADGKKLSEKSEKGKYELLNEKMDAKIAYQDKIKEILSEEQFEKYLQMPKERGKRHQKHHRKKHRKMRKDRR